MILALNSDSCYISIHVVFINITFLFTDPFLNNYVDKYNLYFFLKHKSLFFMHHTI